MQCGCLLHALCASCYAAGLGAECEIAHCNYRGCGDPIRSAFATLAALERLYHRDRENAPAIEALAERIIRAIRSPTPVVQAAAQRCCVCWDESVAATECPRGHALCRDCAAAYLRAELEEKPVSHHAGRQGRIGCPHPACADPLDGLCLLMCAPDEWNAFTTMTRQVGELSRQGEIEALREQLADEAPRVAAAPEGGGEAGHALVKAAPSVDDVLRRICRGGVLNLGCPHCGTAMDCDEFIREATAPGAGRQCMAIACLNGRCGRRAHPGTARVGTGSCFYCGREPDGSEQDGGPHDAHRHVARCSWNPYPGRVFYPGTAQGLREIATRRKQRQLIRWIREQDDILFEVDLLQDLERRLVANDVPATWLAGVWDEALRV